MPSTNDWSTTASGNAAALGINIGEGCPAQNINDAIRELMAEAKVKFDSTDGAVGGIPKYTDNAALAALAAQSPSGDRVPYFTGGNTATLAVLTAFARSLLDDTDAASACNTLGAIRVAACSIGANGYIALAHPAFGAPVYIQWITVTCSAGGATNFTWPVAFPNSCFVAVPGGKHALNFSGSFSAYLLNVTAGGGTAYGNNGASAPSAVSIIAIGN